MSNATKMSDALQEEPRFVADHNVGRLARWLRILGYDTRFVGPIDDRELVRIGLEQGRTILTRDRGLVRRRLVTSGRLRVLLIADDCLDHQLGQVVSQLGLCQRGLPFTRCVHCNEPLEPREREEMQARVPPYVFQTQSSFTQCPTCQRIYWRGTHWERMQQVLLGLSLPQPSSDAQAAMAGTGREQG